MPDFEIIDTHVHLYRSLALEKQNVANKGRRDRDRWGNPEAVTAFMDREGISHVVSLPNLPTRQMRAAMVAELPAELAGVEREAALARIERDLGGRIKRQNEWLCQLAQANPRVVPSVGVQKTLSPQEMADEVRLRAGQGAKTVKLLPGMYLEYPNDRAFWPMYETAQELGLAITSDTGTLGADSGVIYGQPANFAEVLESFPRLRVVMAHFPSAFWDERVELALRFPNVFFDTSGSFNAHGVEVRDGHRALALDDAPRIMRKVGIERFMFGSDGPRFLFHPELEQILAMDLTDAEKKAVLAENAKRIYRIGDASRA